MASGVLHRGKLSPVTTPRDPKDRSLWVGMPDYGEHDISALQSDPERKTSVIAVHDPRGVFRGLFKSHDHTQEPRYDTQREDVT